jgi:hypothetical protein
MGIHYRIAVTMSGLVLTGAAASLTVGAAAPADAGIMGGTPHRLISGAGGGAGGAAAVGPWGAAAGGGGGGGGGTIIYNPNQDYTPFYFLR